MEEDNEPRSEPLSKIASEILNIDERYIHAKKRSGPNGHFSHVDVIIRVPTDRSVDTMGELLRKMIKKN